MRVVHLVPGTGNFYCGACLRDDNLLGGLASSYGHEVVAVPLYLPMVIEESKVDYGPLFLGGLNMYLQEKSGLFRGTPRWIDRMLDAPALLRAASGFAGMTRAEDLGALTLSSLEADEGRQKKEWRRLMKWLREKGKPDVVSLSNGLLMGIAKIVREEMEIPVVASFQGEDSFLDGLPSPWKERCWEVFAEKASAVSRFVAVSESHGAAMKRRIGGESERVRVVSNGIAAGEDGVREAPEVPVIGFFARMCPAKGLHVLVDAFLTLAASSGFERLRLRVGGAMTRGDRSYVRDLQGIIERGGCRDRVEWLANPGRDAKREFLRSLSVLSVPATYDEAFGISLIEAMAQGVPVVQPDRGAFSEIVGRTRGGVIAGRSGSEGLAAALEAILRDGTQLRQLSLQAREGVARHYSLEAMVAGYEAVLREAVEEGGGK